MPDLFEDHCWRDVVDPATLKIYEPYRQDTYIQGDVAGRRGQRRKADGHHVTELTALAGC
jgi:hypothetical protein